MYKNSNGCKGLVYVVKQGDTLYKIAKTYDLKLIDVLKANPYVNVYNLQVGDELCLPTYPNAAVPSTNQSFGGSVSAGKAPMWREAEQPGGNAVDVNINCTIGNVPAPDTNMNRSDRNRTMPNDNMNRSDRNKIMPNDNMNRSNGTMTMLNTNVNRSTGNTSVQDTNVNRSVGTIPDISMDRPTGDMTLQTLPAEDVTFQNSPVENVTFQNSLVEDMTFQNSPAEDMTLQTPSNEECTVQNNSAEAGMSQKPSTRDTSQSFGEQMETRVGEEGCTGCPDLQEQQSYWTQEGDTLGNLLAFFHSDYAYMFELNPALQDLSLPIGIIVHTPSECDH